MCKLVENAFGIFNQTHRFLKLFIMNTYIVWLMYTQFTYIDAKNYILYIFIIDLKVKFILFQIGIFNYGYKENSYIFKQFYYLLSIVS